MSAHNWDGTDDYFDSRDAEDRIGELDIEIADLKRMVKGSEPDDYVMEKEDLIAAKRERRALRKLRAKSRNEISGDTWEDGITFIHDDHFQDYAEEFAYDIGAISRDASWPLTYIDWEAAAEALLQDYSSIEFRGATYWARD